MYCGRALPNPTAPPPRAAARELSPEQDAMLTQALRQGDVRKVREALASVETSPVSRAAPAPAAVPPAAPAPVPPAAPPAVPLAPPPPRVVPPTVPAPRAAPPAPIPSPIPSSVPAPQPSFEALRQQLSQAQALWAEGRHAEAGQSLRALSAAAAQHAELVEQLIVPEPPPEPAPPPAPPTVELPPIRHAWLLVVDGAGDAERTDELAEALDIDKASARVIAISSAPRVVLRGDDPDPLRRRADRCVVRTSLHASVISREALFGLPPALTVLRAPPLGLWGLSAERLWDQSADALQSVVGDSVPRPLPVLAVLGEVVELHMRRADRAGGKLLRSRLNEPVTTSERRFSVLDLYTADACLRLVEGLTELGRDQVSVKLGFRAFEEGLTQAFPGLRVEPRKVCRSMDQRSPSAEQPELRRSGWPLFEEHSRICWLHHRCKLPP